MTERLGQKIQLVGDDIFVTNPQIIARAIREGDRTCVPASTAYFRPSLCAAVCRRVPPFGAAKGQEKGNGA